MKPATSKTGDRNLLRNKDEIIHIAPFKSTAEKIRGEIYIPRTALVNWLRACALEKSTTEVPKNTIKAIIDNIESWEEVA